MSRLAVALSVSVGAKFCRDEGAEKLLGEHVRDRTFGVRLGSFSVAEDIDDTRDVNEDELLVIADDESEDTKDVLPVGVVESVGLCDSLEPWRDSMDEPLSEVDWELGKSIENWFRGSREVESLGGTEKGFEQGGCVYLESGFTYGYHGLHL